MPVIPSWLPSWLRHLSWQAVLVALVSGGIIHIVATLVIPMFATAGGAKRLADTLPVNRMQVLPNTTAEYQPVPFVGPDVRLAVCRYDVTQGPVDISATLPDKGWSIGIYTLQGDNYYVIPAADFRQSDVSLQLIPQTEKLLGFFNFSRSVEANASQIPVLQPQGLIVVRAPMRGRAYQAETEAFLQRAQCATHRG